MLRRKILALLAGMTLLIQSCVPVYAEEVLPPEDPETVFVEELAELTGDDESGDIILDAEPAPEDLTEENLVGGVLP